MLDKNLLSLWVPTHERCGVILNDGTIKELVNLSECPAKEFRMDLDSAGVPKQDIIASWHTHCHGSANLSVDDYAGFQAQPELEHYVVGKDEVWRYIVDGTKVYLYDDETGSF